jgi:hypothetical protein
VRAAVWYRKRTLQVLRRTGDIRNDINREDLLRALVGMCYMHEQPGWRKNVLRLADDFVDELRNRGAKRRTETHPEASL